MKIKKKTVYSIFIFLLSILIKTYRIDIGNAPVWDETHFGKFAYKYLTRRFYFDVHPPLGKMLTALGGWISNQKIANYDFEDYKPYPIDFDYITYRIFHAIIGSFVPLFGFYILRLFKLSCIKSFMGSLLLIFDNGFTMITKIIVLDSHMLAFTAITAYYFCKYHFAHTFNEKEKLLIPLGFFLGCTISIKWIGGLTTMWLGIYIIIELFYIYMYHDLNYLIRAFILRFIFLINLPLALYFIFFLIHFKICNNATSDAQMMSKEFNYRLNNIPFQNSYKYITYGKQITLKFADGYLHSHPHTFPEYLNITNDKNYLKKFQITVYTSQDNNNNFFFQKVNADTDVSFMKYNDEVVILHQLTNGYITIDDSKSFVNNDKRVFGFQNQITDNAIFIIEPSDTQEGFTVNVEALKPFRLKHKKSGVYLSNSKKQLPSWGYKQFEVTGSLSLLNTELIVEENIHSDHQNNSLVIFQKRWFIYDFYELQWQMYTINKNLITDRELEPSGIESRPYMWPILMKGIRLTNWNINGRFYLFMNPLLIYSTTICCLYSLFQIVNNFFQFKKQVFLNIHTKKTNNMLLCRFNTNIVKNITTKYIHKQLFQYYFFIGGYLFHYIPFFFVHRVLYLHHYFPAYFFAILGLVICIRKWKFYNEFIILNIMVYLMYSPVCYGLPQNNYMRWIKIIPTWNFTND